MSGPLGVFDSGFGGLTVQRSLFERLPGYDTIYLGDSARAPYGPRSFDAILQFTQEAVEALFAMGCPVVILACNTASARALRTLQQRLLPLRWPDRRLLGVVRPSAEALAGFPVGGPAVVGPSDATGVVAVLGTEGTVRSESYRIELAHLAPRLTLVQQPCPLWVPLVEAGELSGSGVDHFLHRYIDPLFQPQSGLRPSRILLGCTHYPLLLPGIRAIVPKDVEILVQGEIVAASLADWLHRHPEFEQRLQRNGTRRFFTTDDPAWFSTQAGRILGSAITAEMLHLMPVPALS